LSESTLRVGIIGDGFMQPAFFEKALRARLPERDFDIKTMYLDWPLTLKSTKYDKTLPIGEFLGRPEDYYDFCADREVLILHTAPIVDETFARAPDLRLVAVARGGPVNVETAAAKKRGIPVVNTPGRNASAVAEFTVASLLAETRNIVRGHLSVKDGSFRRDFYHHDHAGPELCELTVGIVGFGDIGMRVARLLVPFGCRILVADPYKQISAREEADLGIRKVPFDQLIAESDVVTLHPRVTPETKNMLGRAQIAQMKRGSYIVNTTRGQVLDYDALYDALVSGQIRGAALDTFEPEPPPPDWPLLQLPNVTLSPHIAGASIFSITKAATMLAEDIARILDGQPPLYPAK
jgi:D-3-phosphoglycerate dehydrogenase